MDLTSPVGKSSYNKINQTLRNAACSVQEDVMREGTRFEYSLAADTGDKICNTDISFDGKYKTGDTHLMLVLQ